MRTQKIILLGVGGVGRSLIEQIVNTRSFHAAKYQLAIEVTALGDSGGLLSCAGDESGLSDEVLREVVGMKASGSGLAQHERGSENSDPVSVIKCANHADTIVVDCTASEATVSALLRAIDSGFKIVLANKIPLTLQREVYSRLTTAETGQRDLSRSRWETTVGAGLPVIATLGRLTASGDRIERITGTFSGTLGYVMSGLQDGKLLSQIVREAYDLGYTEPDPRDDLGGIDVARKALILARGMGWELDMADVQVEGLYPPSMDELTVGEFLDALPELDASVHQQVQKAQANNQVLRYAATVENGQCRVVPTVVDAGSPLGRLTGTDNLVEFLTHWYNPNPLVIQGRGAGVEATAAGVLSDIVELAFA